MTIPSFANGGMNVTGLRLVDFTEQAVKSYIQGWSVVNRNARTIAGTSHSKIIPVRMPSSSSKLLLFSRIAMGSKSAVYCVDATWSLSVSLSVCLSVGHNSEPYKTAKPIEVRFA